MKIIYLVPGYWGKGKNIPEARKKCKEAGASTQELRSKYMVYACPDDETVITGMGGLSWHGEDPEVNRPVLIDWKGYVPDN